MGEFTKTEYKYTVRVLPARPEKGPLFEWNVAGAETAQTFANLAAFARATGHEARGMVVDPGACFAGPAPMDFERDYAPQDLDLRLAPGSPAVDAGVRLPTLNDDFTGEAPDLGAYERGRPVPHYGPRPE